ncbi:hypothetical protein POK33_38615 [Burkholderia cenocepacia]|uniref:hypothetical protein n=1 Tax=Burkholderia cenocepacia TaxID=95486 RepID=UPI0023B8B9F3|nr:hypothetical protein [Burkholderia cenocepacia]MDF0506670.1 hypothetical protein [Burkholderia cenocepacia]
MLDIEAHKESLESLLTTSQVNHVARFGVWCCIGLTHDESVFEFLASKSGGTSTQIRDRVLDYLNEVWQGHENTIPLRDIEQVDWDPDEIEMSDEAAAQGATDLLAGLAFLGKWCTDHKVKELASCAEVLINRIDYLESFGLIDGNVANPVDHEVEIQRIFASDLADGNVTDNDKRKYHEWLFDNGNS